MNDVRCPICGLVIPVQGVDMGSQATCTCKFQVKYLTSDIITDALAQSLSKQLKSVWDWKATLYGRIDGQKEPVPDAFQNAFKDGELDL